MRKKIIYITITMSLVACIGFVLASNKSKIDAAARPQKTTAVIPVKAWTVKQDSFATSFTLNGTTVPYREVKISAEVPGKLINVFVKNGDRLRAGQVIASLDPSVYTAQLRSVESSIAKAELDIERYTRLLSLGGATQMQLENVILQLKSLIAQKKEVLQQIDHMQIRSPFTGILENLNVETGSYVSYGSVIGTLIDNSSLKINVYLSEQEAFKTKHGQQVTVHNILLAQPLEANITMLSGKADATGKFLAEINLDNKQNKLKAGMLTDVTFASGSSETGLSLPVSAIVGSTKQPRVFVVNGTTVTQKKIKTGIVTTEKIKVTEGLQPGEIVVTSGQLNLENGSSVSIIK
jgi:membrane fusion protein, multidrug efflux system